MPPKVPKPRSKEAEAHAAALLKAGISTRANASEKSLRAMAKVLNSKAPVDPSTGEKEQLTYTNAEERQSMKAAGGAGTTENNEAGIESYAPTGSGGLRDSRTVSSITDAVGNAAALVAVGQTLIRGIRVAYITGLDLDLDQLRLQLSGVVERLLGLGESTAAQTLLVQEHSIHTPDAPDAPDALAPGGNTGTPLARHNPLRLGENTRNTMSPGGVANLFGDAPLSPGTVATNAATNTIDTMPPSNNPVMQAIMGGPSASPAPATPQPFGGARMPGLPHGTPQHQGAAAGTQAALGRVEDRQGQAERDREAKNEHAVSNKAMGAIVKATNRLTQALEAQAAEAKDDPVDEMAKHAETAKDADTERQKLRADVQAQPEMNSEAKTPEPGGAPPLVAEGKTTEKQSGGRGPHDVGPIGDKASPTELNMNGDDDDDDSLEEKGEDSDGDTEEEKDDPDQGAVMPSFPKPGGDGGGGDGGGGGGAANTPPDGPGPPPAAGVPGGTAAAIGGAAAAGAVLVAQNMMGGPGGSMHPSSTGMLTFRDGGGGGGGGSGGVGPFSASTPYHTVNENYSNPMYGGKSYSNSTSFKSTLAQNVYTYEQKLSEMEAERRATGATATGVGISENSPVPVAHIDACRYFFRSQDYTELEQYYAKGANLTPDAKRQFPGDKAVKVIKQIIATYGRPLKINKPMSLQQGQDAQIREALELQQLSKAYSVYQKETQGMYFANNTVESALDSAVQAVLNGNQTGIYPYTSGQSGQMVHTRQPSESTKQPMQGKFKMPENKRRKLNPFRPINFAM